MKTRDITLCSIFASVTAIMAQLSIPMPLGVPITLQTLAVSLTGIVLGAKKGVISVFIYILLGAIGLPIFSNHTGGIQMIFGPTGGFIVSFPIMAYIIGKVSKKTNNKYLIFCGMMLGAAVNLIMGAVVFGFIMNVSTTRALSACVTPFIFPAVLKSLVSTFLGIQIKAQFSHN